MALAAEATLSASSLDCAESFSECEDGLCSPPTRGEFEFKSLRADEPCGAALEAGLIDGPVESWDGGDALQSLLDLESAGRVDAVTQARSYERLCDYERRYQALGWVAEVSSTLGLHSETFYLATSYFDRMVSLDPATALRSDHIVAAAALSLAAKLRELVGERVYEFFVGNGYFSSAHLRAIELHVVRALDWRLTTVSPQAVCEQLFSLLVARLVIASPDVRASLRPSSFVYLDIAALYPAAVSLPQSFLGAAAIIAAIRLPRIRLSVANLLASALGSSEDDLVDIADSLNDLALQMASGASPLGPPAHSAATSDSRRQVERTVDCAADCTPDCSVDTGAVVSVN